MKRTIIPTIILIFFAALLHGCTANVQPQASSSPNSSPSAANTVSVTLPVLDKLFSDKVFTAALKAKMQLTDEQIAALKKISSAELGKLPAATGGNQIAAADGASERVFNSIRDLLGTEKTDQIMALALERQSDQAVTAPAADEPVMLKGPNAVPPDTRIIVNIPAFRMDIFREGTLVKSYRIGIGYQQFPLPTGFRKAEMIIFNPTWTQPNESWASNPGEVVPAGDKGNPLGPIKVPIGGANLIHGGKPLAKIGTFASHGCVGLTNDQVKEFAKVLAEATNTALREETIAAYLKRPTRTQVVKLSKLVPVELRYETIVIQDGQLHVYRDVYNKNSNTEENLRAALEANGLSFDSLSEEEKTQALAAVNAMSLHPKAQPAAKPLVATNLNPADKRALAAERKTEAERQRKLRNQKEIVIDLASSSGKGYPAPKDLNTGAARSTLATVIEPDKPKPPRRNPTPEPQLSPEEVQPPRSTASPR